MTDKKAILLRIPPDLWGLLNLWARDDLRSLNAQIEFILREAVRKRTNKAPPEPQPDKPIRLDTTESYSPTQDNG